jgi:Putative beta barrel porin-7 (BBP7)
VSNSTGGGDMGTARFTAASIAAICGTALFAALPLGIASAADLPLKAPPKIPDSGSLFWGEIDYLGWSVKGDRPPPLVTTSPAGTPRIQAGVIGAPGTTVLFGDSSVNGAWRSGGRLQAGYWFDPSRTKGIEVSFFDLQDVSTGFAANSGTNAILARPFFNAATNAQDATLVSFPGVATGAIAVNETSRLLGAGALYRQQIGMWGGQRISALIGYRYLHSSDDLSIPTNSNFIGGGGIPAVAVSVFDAFGATSDFHGVDLGLTGEWKGGPWALEWRGKVALGANFNSANISGLTAITFGGVTTTLPGGLLALSSNSGNFSQTRFSVVPEIALKAGYQVAPHWRIVAGYDALYWTDVQRAGGLIDPVINPNLVPPVAPGGPLRPMPVFNTSPLWAQGFNVGVRYDY